MGSKTIVSLYRLTNNPLMISAAESVTAFDIVATMLPPGFVKVA